MPVSAAAVHVYVLGGRDNRGRTMSNVECLSVWDRSWTQCPSLAEARGSHAAECLDGQLYCIAGGGRYSNLDTVESWNPLVEGSGWVVQDAKIKEPRHALSCCLVNKELFIVGGWKFGSEAARTVERWSGSGEWTDQPSLNYPRRLHAVCSLGDSIYVFGGAGSGFGLLNSAERYRVGASQWEPIKCLPCPSYASACAIGNHIYVFMSGGRVLRYDPLTDAYEPLSSLPVPDWFGFSACASAPFAFLFGGTSCGRVTPAAFCYDASTDLWHRLPDIPTRRRRAIAVTFRH